MARAIRGTLILLFFLIASVLSLFSADTEPSAVLTGIVSVNDPKFAPLKKAMIAIGPDVRSELLLSEGDRHGGFEILEILPGVGKVVVTRLQTVQPIDLELFRPVLKTNGVPAFQFRSASMHSVVYVLQELSQRTIIASPDALGRRLTLTTAPFKSRSEALAGLEQRIRTNGFLLKSLSDKFEVMVSADEADLCEAISIPSRGPAAEKIPVGTDEAIPPGMISLDSTHPLQVFQIYQELSGRTLISPENLSAPGITVHSQTPLSRREAIWTFDAALRLSGVVMIPESDKFVFAVPPKKTNGLPRFDRAAQMTKNTAAPIKPGLMSLTDTDITKVLEIYASLVGRQIVPPPSNLPATKFTIRTQTPLDQNEAAYALEALAWANDVAFDPVGPDKITVIPLPEPNR